ncbi:Uncharacterised protein [Mycobacteroides abscessus subsp. abscessus]|uniref:Uncharacterized protein n=2 Tax=Mycobacteroides abscessus TaxID=36809 RepID=A0A829Q6T3_9MYCO|nr:hypothetical protein [Mycobacteroides abscessus]EUA48752.1 hypothetical protein I543_1165 [Mycobacteroides abscessus 21]MBE5494376.1 hypothetical protein [Mycobacteroides abscessus]SHP47990.1 Uncharacterised protein [Mycobacteroides abscessus subsp. abscessus]SHP49345.1 Uncharacterised protein [Mycobacteroides abscessus subsp. abscessus]SHP66895.1 Uncharacterised protein [Mycobacteroides abscessus subsp. abscessus]
MPEQDMLVGGDRELRLVVTSLQRLALRVESRFNPDSTEGAVVEHCAEADGELVAYARRCVDVLEDPGVIARLLASQRPRW